MVIASLQSKSPAADLFDEFDVAAATDITGFVLPGHLVEMLRPANLAAVLDWDKLRLLPGARELLAEGLQSTLAPANRHLEQEIDDGPALNLLSEYGILFDPQTCGGLLVGVSDGRAMAVLPRLQEIGYQAELVGHTME